MAKKKTKNVKMLSQYEEDCVWMSSRYCIGRHTIASHCHAEDIAKNAYGRMTKERTQFMSKDINNEIHSQLHYGNFVDMGWYGNIPKSHFRPLDVVYSILDSECIDSYEKMREIKQIAIDWNREKGGFDYSVYYYTDNDKKKDLGRSFSDLSDLEVWQQLANLFDLKGHKWCKLIDNTICEYYECWKHYRTMDGLLKFKKYKQPVDRYYNFNTYIPEENIKEDNVEPNKE